MALPLLALHRAGRWAARITGDHSGAGRLLLVVAATATYAGVALGVAQVSSIGGAAVPTSPRWGGPRSSQRSASGGEPPRGQVCSRRWATGCPTPCDAPPSCAGVLRVRRSWSRRARCRSSRSSRAGRPSPASGARSRRSALEAGRAAAALVAYLPNLLLWALSYLAGPGFAAGGGATVDPFSASGRCCPACLCSVRSRSTPRRPRLCCSSFRWWRGCSARWRCADAARCRWPPRPAPYCWARSAWARWRSSASALAGGALGSARLAQLGPHALLTGLALAGLVAAGGLLVLLTARVSRDLLPTIWVHGDD